MPPTCNGRSQFVRLAASERVSLCRKSRYTILYSYCLCLCTDVIDVRVEPLNAHAKSRKRESLPFSLRVPNARPLLGSRLPAQDGSVIPLPTCSEGGFFFAFAGLTPQGLPGALFAVCRDPKMCWGERAHVSCPLGTAVISLMDTFSTYG
ncbi:hypothetical protein BDZ88DRAFT_61338 [Geranomyces variabilis]|nr:hypothetical protein BDZ88DRAFT_61338 [Geranomyces variabilis]